MPPEDSKHPSRERRDEMLRWIEKELAKGGKEVDPARLHPSKANLVDHDRLFSGNGTSPGATRGRLWRLMEPAYEDFFSRVHPFERETRVYEALADRPVAMDILVRTPEEIESYRRGFYPFWTEVLMMQSSMLNTLSLVFQ